MSVIKATTEEQNQYVYFLIQQEKKSVYQTESKKKKKRGKKQCRINIKHEMNCKISLTTSAVTNQKDRSSHNGGSKKTKIWVIHIQILLEQEDT